MPARHHLNLFIQGMLVWAAFWLGGLPHYYQQYSVFTMGIGCVLLSVLISLLALFVLLRGKPQTRMSRAIWISFYYTVPLAVLDTLYCRVHLNHGASYLYGFWYLTVFCFTPWLTFIPTALLLQRNDATKS